MNLSCGRDLLSSLITLIVVALPIFAMSAAQLENDSTTLAIVVGSSATRLSFLVGDNGPVFGDNGEPKIIWVGPGTRSTPGPLKSNWTTDGYLFIKDGTDEAQYVHPSNTVFNLDLPKSIRSMYDINNRPRAPGYRAFSLIDITAKYLYELVASAESIVGQAITSITIVLPDGQNIRTTAKEILNDRLKGNYTLYDHFNVDESGSTDEKMVAEALSGLDDRGIYCTSYRRSYVSIFPFAHGMEYSRGVLVYHLGASRFEVSVHEVDGGSYETVSSIYDQNLGGNDFNRLVIDHLLLVHKNKTGQDLRNDETFLNRLGSEVEYAKRVLSVQDWAQIDIESLQPGGQDLSEMLTRSQFEDVNMVLFNKTIMAIDQVLKESLMYTKDDIQDVVFSGGSAKVPFLQSAIREYFGSHPKYHGSDHSEDTVVLGAAKLAHWFQDRRHFDGAVCCFGVTPSTIGIKTADGAMFTFTDRDSDFLEINKMFTFSTAMDNQDRVVVRVFREDEERADQNVFLGGVELTGLAPAPKGDPKIRVRITSYSCGNYINLNVMDVATGRINGSIFTLSQPFLHDYGEEFQYAMLEEGSAEIKAAGEMILLPGN